jgi:hypothetical protein
VLEYSALPTDPVLPSPAPEILDYLARHPDAQDTIDGILQWWILNSSLRLWAPKISEVVAQLVDEGCLEERRAGDGQLFYRLAARHRPAIADGRGADGNASESE